MKNFFLTILALSLMHVSTYAEIYSEVFDIGFASSEEVEALVKPLLSAKGKMVILEDRGKVLIQHENENTVTQAGQLIRELTAPRPNVRVNVSFQEMIQNNSSDIAWDSDRYQKPGVYQRSGNTIKVRPIERNVYSSDDVYVSGNVRNQTSSRMSNQFLVVRSGHRASLRVGSDVPFIDYFYAYAFQLGYTRLSSVRWRSIGTFLSIKPTVLANGLIDIEVTPEISSLIDGKRQTIQYRNLSTHVTIAPGVEVTIGGFSKAAQGFNVNFFKGLSSRNNNGSHSFKISASLM
ncbi:MAG: hypothetical protein AAF984_04170 [Verrucomicrobiota bacterium]